MESYLNVDQIKSAARGRWQEILAAVGGIDSAVLDGKNHPCPRCGGKDRFRLIDTEAGAVLCNQCFKTGNGDGFAAIQWMRGIDFPTALRLVATYLGVNGAPPPTSSGSGNGKPRKKTQSGGKIVAAYDYSDEQGNVLFQVVRFEPKDFRQRRPDGKDGWIWDVKGVRVVPYLLHRLAKRPNENVIVVEGEKDCIRLTKLGFLATCNAGGAGKWTADHARYLAGRHVAIFPDNDDAGRKHAEQVARSLVGIAARVRIVELPGLPEKGDVSDWLAMHGGDQHG